MLKCSAFILTRSAAHHGRWQLWGLIATKAPSFAPALYPRSMSLDIRTRPSSWSF